MWMDFSCMHGEFGLDQIKIACQKWFTYVGLISNNLGLFLVEQIMVGKVMHQSIGCCKLNSMCTNCMVGGHGV